MSKARSYVESVKSRGAKCCAFLAHAWKKTLCRWNWHDDQLGEWSTLELVVGNTRLVVGDRIVWRCARCPDCLRADHFASPALRQQWDENPDKQRVTLRDWSK